MSKEIFLCYSLYSGVRFMCVYIYTHMAYTTVDLFPFVCLLRLAGVPDYTPRPVFLFSVI